jgi:hypothetical protein
VPSSTQSPSPARSLDRLLRCAAFPTPASPLFSVRASRSLHTGGLVRANDRNAGVRNRSINTARPGGHASFVTVTSSTAGRGFFFFCITVRIKSTRRIRSPGSWPDAAACTFDPCTHTPAESAGRPGAYRDDDMAARRACGGTREGSSLQAFDYKATAQPTPTKCGCRYSARARAPPSHSHAMPCTSSLKPRTPPRRAHTHTSPPSSSPRAGTEAKASPPVTGRSRPHGDATAAIRRRRRRRRPRAGRRRVAADVAGLRRGGGAGERAVEPDQGAGGRAGGAVRARPAHPQRGADTADHGQAAGARRHRGQERLLLVPEPQGPPAPEAEAGQLRLLQQAPPPAPAAARALHAPRATVPSRPRPGAARDADADAAAARCMQRQRRRAWYVYHHHRHLIICFCIFLYR